MWVGDSPEEPRADQTVRSPVQETETTARVTGLRGEHLMTARPHPDPLGGGSAQVKSCWMCGIRLPAGQMMPDGGSACPDVRWYCRDTWGCTKRWTSRSGRLTAVRPEVAEQPQAPAERPAGLVAAKPMAV